MAPSSGTYVLEGVKLSIDLLEKISGDLPAPTSTVLGLVQQIIVIVETIQDNQEQCQLLVGRLIRLLLVILADLKQKRTGKQGHPEIPPDLKSRIEQFKDTLDRILKKVTKIQKIVNSKRWKDRLRAALFAGSYKADVKKCHDQLDWAITEFDVASRLKDAIRLCMVSRQVQQIFTNQTLDTLPIAKYARFDCERPDRPSSCFKGTREAIIKEIIDWITDSNPKAQRFFWLNGLAGIGKTTIAHSIAERARSLGLLGASFFFSRRGEAELRNPALVFPTIAHQLALFDREFCERITAAIEADAQAPYSSLKEQLDRLIVEPLRGLERDPDRVVIIVLDAFDECESVGANTILQLLVAAIPSFPFFLKLFVTSRPESHIQSVLVPSNNDLRITALHDINTSVVSGDITLYLTAELTRLQAESGATDWNGLVAENDIAALAKAAGTLFIYAKTILRVLSEAPDFRTQLNRLLETITSHGVGSEGSTPFLYLDILYIEVLHGPITKSNRTEFLRLYQTVLGTIVLLRDPIRVDALERLVGLSGGGTSRTFGSLRSVILSPPYSLCPRIYHPSFSDFLQDPARCPSDTGFLIDTQQHEERMALHCLELLNTKANLHKGMVVNVEPALLNSEVENLKDKDDVVILSELEYACLYWASHLVKVPFPEDRRNQKIRVALATFASLQLLPWLELMSRMGRTREAVRCLEAVNSWVPNSSASSITINLLNDVYRLILAHFPLITQSASHIARSVLPFAPRNTQLRTTYADYADVKAVKSVAISANGARVASGSADHTVHIHDASSGAFIMALRGHFGRVQSVAFSPDGSRVASGSDDRTIRLWDATTGHELLKLEGHTETVYSIAFFPDGSRIASGSVDKTVRVWDSITGGALMTLIGHSDRVMSVGLFPDGSRLVSGSADKTIRIWSLAGRTCVAILEGHSDEVFSVAISPDGSRIASGSIDRTIRIWNGSNGDSLATLRGHTGTINSVAFSPTGSRIVSGSADASLRLWDAMTGNGIVTFHGHTDFVRSAAFSPDGRCIVSGSQDATVKIWDESVVTETVSQSSFDTTPVTSLAFSSSGTRLASTDHRGNVQVRDLVTGVSIISFQLPRTDFAVLFSPDDTQLILIREGSSMAFDASSGNCISENGPPFFYGGFWIPFEVVGGRLLRTDVSPPATVFILPPSHHTLATASMAFKLGGALGYRVAIGFQDGRVIVVDIPP